MNSLFRIALFAILTIATIALTACNPNTQSQPDRDMTYGADHNIDPYTYDQPVPDSRDRSPGWVADNNNTGLFNQQAPESPNNDTTSQEVADRLVALATRVDQVNDATAVVVGRYAVVGIDIDADLDRSRVGSIKYSVAEALKADPKGAYAIVTADADTNARLREMAQEIREGRPVAGIMEELADIVGRLMPQVPRAVPDNENPDGTPRSPEEQNKRNQ